MTAKPRYLVPDQTYAGGVSKLRIGYPAAARWARVVIHSVDHAKTALSVAEEQECAICLVSAPGAAAYAGAGWFKSVIQEAGDAYPSVPLEAVLDCGDCPGYALGALRIGLKRVSFHGSREVTEQLRMITQGCHARLEEALEPVLDLSEQADPVQACRVWLSGTGKAGD